MLHYVIFAKTFPNLTFHGFYGVLFVHTIRDDLIFIPLIYN